MKYFFLLIQFILMFSTVLFGADNIELEASTEKQEYVIGEVPAVDIIVRNNSDMVLTIDNWFWQNLVEVISYFNGEIQRTGIQIDSHSSGVPCQPNQSINRSNQLLTFASGINPELKKKENTGLEYDFNYFSEFYPPGEYFWKVCCYGYLSNSNMTYAYIDSVSSSFRIVTPQGREKEACDLYFHGHKNASDIQLQWDLTNELVNNYGDTPYCKLALLQLTHRFTKYTEDKREWLFNAWDEYLNNNPDLNKAELHTIVRKIRVYFQCKGDLNGWKSYMNRKIKSNKRTNLGSILIDQKNKYSDM